MHEPNYEVTMSTTNEQKQYEGTVTAVGNSTGVRMPKAFWNEHPEFIGKVRLTVVAEGQVLLTAARQPQRARKEELDPVMASFLQFIENEMIAHPELIEPADPDQLRRIGKLVKGVR